MTTLALATEDELSEAIALRLLAEWDVLSATPPLLLRKSGNGYLRSRMSSWRQMAEKQIVVVLTDLDRVACPIALLSDWFGNNKRPENLLLRIAVREVESWVLADHEALRCLLGKKGKLPNTPDELPNPKQHLINLARLAPTSVKRDLVQAYGAVASQGMGYNRLLVRWVHTEWSPIRAAQRSPSLKRTYDTLNELANGLKGLGEVER